MGDSMSTIINATTTNGVVIQPDNSGSLVLQTNNGTTALTVDTSQNTTLAGKLTTASSGIQFSDASIQTAAASPYVLKNRIINGDFQVWQRATSATFSSDNVYNTADRWQTSMYASGFALGTRTVSRQEFTTGSSPNGSRYFFQMAPNSAADSLYTYMQQPIEDVTQFSNVYVTLSYWASVSSGTISVTSVFRQVFGTGGSPSSAVDTSFPSVTIDTTWKKYSVTVLLPSISGKTLGTNNNSNGLLYLLETTNLNGATYRVSQVQLEIGTSATPFERRTYGQELANCYRYFEMVYATYGTWISGSSLRIWGSFAVPKRTRPSAIMYATTTYAEQYNINATSVAASIGSNYGSTNIYDIVLNGFSTSFTVGYIGKAGNNSDTTTWALPFVGFSAEL